MPRLGKQIGCIYQLIWRAVCYIQGVTLYCCCFSFFVSVVCLYIFSFLLLFARARCTNAVTCFHRDQVHSIMTLTDYDGLQKRRHGVLQRRIFFSKVCMSLMNSNQEKIILLTSIISQIVIWPMAMHCGRISLKTEKWRHSLCYDLDVALMTT